MQNRGDITPVKEKKKVEIHKNIFAGFELPAVVWLTRRGELTPT